MNDYWLSAEGVCWRTEVVAWLFIPNQERWERMLEGTYDPEEEEKTGKRATTTKRKRKGNVEAHRVICASWVASVEVDAENALNGLKAMPDLRYRRLSGRRGFSCTQPITCHQPNPSQ